MAEQDTQGGSPDRAIRRSGKRGRPPEPVPHPFVKAVGGKRRLLPELLKRAPVKFRRYWEFFVGGGALFFALARLGRFRGNSLAPALSDKNELLVRAYRGVRDDVGSVVTNLALYAQRHCREEFLRIRSANPALLSSDAVAAAWFTYISLGGFNGLFRVNRKGECNTPYGDGSPIRVDGENLRACSRALRGVTLVSGDFEECAREVWRGDFVYLDPPYDPPPEKKTAGFTGYTAGGFTEADQERLADCAARMRRAGARVLLTNSDTPLVRRLYPEAIWTVERVEVRGDALNSDPSKRGKVGELVIS